MQPRLAQVQRLLYRLIISPNGVEEGLAAENDVPKNGIGALITGDDRMNAVDRVGIYADMYFYRLLDAIREDFPATVAILGNAHFHNLTSYLVAYPPSRPSITDASLHLAEFVQHSVWCDEFPFLRDVILLERALLEVFLGADAVAVSFDELRAVPPSAWASLQFRGHPASRVLDCEWRVDQVLCSVEKALPIRPPLRQRESIAVWRKDDAVRYRVLSDLERLALGLIRSGTQFESVCQSVPSRRGDRKVPTAIIEMLARWVADGLLVREQKTEDVTDRGGRALLSKRWPAVR